LPPVAIRGNDMDFLRSDNIEIRYFSDAWGPFVFDFADAIPDGDSIDTVDVKAYEGIIRPSDAVAGWDEITDLVEAAPSVVGTTIEVTLQYPTDTTLKNTRATLVFELTMTSGAKHPFFFHHINIK